MSRPRVPRAERVVGYKRTLETSKRYQLTSGVVAAHALPVGENTTPRVLLSDKGR